MNYLPRTVIYSFVIILFLFAGCRSSVSGRKTPAGQVNDAYYVNALSGDDSNNGTKSHPVKTIARLNQLLNSKALSVYLAGSQTYQGTLILKNIAGKVDAPFFVTSAGSGRAVINGADSEAVHIENCRNISVKNIELRGNGRKGGNTTNGLSLSSSEGCVISNVTVRGFQASGIGLFDCRNTRVMDVYASDNGFSGINVLGSDRHSSGNIVIRNCRAENNPGDPAILDNHSGNGILVGMSDSVLIDHCTAINNGWDMPRKGNGPVGIWAWESNNVIIQYCISCLNKTSKDAMDGGGFDLDGGVTNSSIIYCLSYGNQGAGYGLFQFPGASRWSGNSVQYCISINDATTTKGAGSIFVWNGSGDTTMLEDCMICNNVIYNDAHPLVSFEQASSHADFRFCNNIFVGNGSVVEGELKGSTFLGNNWWHTGSGITFGHWHSLADWAEHTGQEMLNGHLAGSCLDPLFQGQVMTDLTDPMKLGELTGFILKNNSPLKNKGLDIKSLFNYTAVCEDFYGNRIPEGTIATPGIYLLR